MYYVDIFQVTAQEMAGDGRWPLSVTDYSRLYQHTLIPSAALTAADICEYIILCHQSNAAAS